jgi:thioredoxin reductase
LNADRYYDALIGFTVEASHARIYVQHFKLPAKRSRRELWFAGGSVHPQIREIAHHCGVPACRSGRKILQKKMKTHENVRWPLNRQITSIIGKAWVSSITVKDRVHGIPITMINGGRSVYGALEDEEYIDETLKLG